MKWFLSLFVICSFDAFAKTATNFNQTLNDELSREIRKDEEKFRKNSFRKPASVESTNPVIEETSKIDKNVRQIGPNKW